MKLPTMTKFPTLPSTIEFPASAQTMVGNHCGSCLLYLTGAAITVKFSHGEEIASWPYNCIRQFRADEDTRQFSFYSGRRGPYGVAEYKFDMTEPMLLALQDALTQFTGARFGSGPLTSMGSSTSLNSPAVDQRFTGFNPDSYRSPKHDPLPEIPGTAPSNMEVYPGYTSHRSPDVQLMQNHKHSATDIFATLSKEQRHRTNSSSLGRPPVPTPYNSRTLDTRTKRGVSSINTKYHEVAGNFGVQGSRGNLISGSPVPAPQLAGGPGVGYGGSRKMSHGDEVFRSTTMSPARTAKLARQTTVPTYRKMYGSEEADIPYQQGAVFSPLSSPPTDQPAATAGEEEGSDLDFGNTPLRRSSPQVDRKTIKRGRISPPDRQQFNAPHDLYSVPRSSAPGSSSSPPHSDDLYKVPRDTLSQESAEVPPTFGNSSPTGQENLYNVPKSVINDMSDLYSSQRPHRQPSCEEVPSTPDTGGIVIYNVPPARQQTVRPPAVPPQMVKPQGDGYELYNTPKPALLSGYEPSDTPAMTSGNSTPTKPVPGNGTPKPTPEHVTPAENEQELYYNTTSKATPTSGHEMYNVPRAALESHLQQEEDADGFYKVPRSLEGIAPDGGYKGHKASERPGNYDSLQAAPDSSDSQTNNGSPRFSISSRKPLPTPDQDTYSVPRMVNSSSPSNGRRTADGRYPYEYVDHTLPRIVNGTLKSSRSLESLVHRRVNVSPEAPSPQTQTQPQSSVTHTARSYRTPSPRALQHKYTEIDIDHIKAKRGQQQQQQPQHRENLYCEISDNKPVRRSSQSTSTFPSTVNPNDHYAIVPSNIRASAINTTPQPSHSNRKTLPSSNGSHDSVSKEARALHEEGYELVLPAHEAARNRAIHQLATAPMNISRAQHQAPHSHSIQVANDRFPQATGNGLSALQLSSSGPLDSNSQTDEYVIVQRRDSNQMTQPRDIPVPLPQARGNRESFASTAPSSRPEEMEQYEVMTSVQREVSELDKGTGGRRASSKFEMVPPAPVKKRDSVPISQGSISLTSVPRSDAVERQSLRNSLDMDSIESGSRASAGSFAHLEEVAGPLSPFDMPGTSPMISHPQAVPGKKNMVRIASGSPHDIAPSKDLRIRSLSVENILDQKEGEKSQKYENVTDEDLAAKQGTVQLTGLPRKPPMPLPRPTRSEH